MSGYPIFGTAADRRAWAFSRLIRNRDTPGCWHDEPVEVVPAGFEENRYDCLVQVLRDDRWGAPRWMHLGQVDPPVEWQNLPTEGALA